MFCPRKPKGIRTRSRLGAITLTLLVGVTLLAPVTAVASAASSSSSEPVFAEFPPGTNANDLPVGVAWGYNNKGQLGVGSSNTSFSPLPVNGGTQLDNKQISMIDVGNQSACAIAVGKLYCWGDNQLGQVGVGSTTTEFAVAQAVSGPWGAKPVASVSVGAYHACAVADGKLYCWGNNSSGQLGVGSLDQKRLSPSLIGGALNGKTISSVSAGDNHTCAIGSGAAFCWGSNTNGQLGNGVTASITPSPSAVNAANALFGQIVTSVAAGATHSCAVAAGAVSCWGNNNHGQLGTTFVANNKVPTQVGGMLTGLTVNSLSVGGDVSCVVAGTGAPRKPYCWGRNDVGQLGSNSSGDSPTPKAVYIGSLPSEKSVSSISVNAYGGCFIYQGRGFCFGDGDTGRLGNGFPQDAPTPTGMSTQNIMSGRRLQTVSATNWTTAGIAVTTKTFKDVPSSMLFYDDISWLAGSGTAQGYDDGKYRPGTTTDRQAMAAFVFRFTNPGITAPACAGNTRIFTDVAKSSPFCGAIEALVTANIITVPANKKYSPADPITRATMADFLFRAHHRGMPDRICTGLNREFADVLISTPSCGNIEWLASTGVTTGYAGNLYKPAAAVERQAMAAFMHRSAELVAH